MTFRILPEAQEDANESARWYSDRDSSLGEEFLTEVAAGLDAVKRDPHALTRLESYTGRLDIRRKRLQRFPFLLIILCRPHETVVVAVAHTKRRPHFWLNRLG